MRLPDFVHPFDSYEPAFELNQSEVRVTGDAGAKVPSGADRTASAHPTAQDSRMFRNFANQVFSGKLNEEWPMWALKTQQVMDACFESARNGSGEVTL